jgi:hypothetical protein
MMLMKKIGLARISGRKEGGEVRPPRPLFHPKGRATLQPEVEIRTHEQKDVKNEGRSDYVYENKQK